MIGNIVIVGASHAGVELAASLRSEGYDGGLTLISAERELPYQRPPLSKAFLKPGGGQLLPLRPEPFYAKRAIELRLGQRVVGIDRQARRVSLADGGSLAYDRLALAPGAVVRRPQVAGSELPGVAYLRDAADAQALLAAIPSVEAIAVVGGGFIGLEVAATLAALDKQVTLLEAAPRLMGRAVPPVISDHALARQRAWGVEVRLATPLGRILGQAGRVGGIETAEGERIAAELVVIGIGVLPEVSLAEAAGLAIGDGIAVDAGMATSDPTIVAAGDATVFDYAPPGATEATARADDASLSGAATQPMRRLRLESVQNATDQAKVAARTLLGRPAAYRPIPWFWSDQGDLKLQMVGLPFGADRQILRGDPESGRFSVFHYAGEHLCAIDSVNRPADHLLGRRMLAAGWLPPPALVAAADSDLKALFEATHPPGGRQPAA
jgi:3-phenylpropionate/trans-cinnamate dioxygenase ferredoxin reductase subunit